MRFTIVMTQKEALDACMEWARRVWDSKGDKYLYTHPKICAHFYCNSDALRKGRPGVSVFVTLCEQDDDINADSAGCGH